MKGSEKMFRIGSGYDVHRLVPERKLILGGVDIPHHLGLLGHSDADVLIHAVIDSLMGAAALGDIGSHFPDSSDEYKNIDSRILLRRTAAIFAESGYTVCNVDATVICQKPKLAPHIEEMRKNIASDLKLDISQISVKATTEEKLGFTGREEGIAAFCSSLCEKK